MNATAPPHQAAGAVTPLSPPWRIGCGHAGADAARDDADAPLPGVEVIGGKAHHLARMAALGLPVPPAFVIDTSACHRHRAHPHALWDPDRPVLRAALADLETATGLHFGDARRPLLLSVRSGAPVSMPGMMETLLDIGLNDETVQGLIRLTGNPRLAWDAYRRLVAGYGEVVLGLPATAFDADLAEVAAGCAERDLDFDACRRLTRRHLDTVQRLSGRPFPQSPDEQLLAAIGAVFASWWSPRADTYRRLHRIDDGLGTAVIVQRMVFGNAGGASGAGVAFTRHPSTGEPEPWVDFLFNAQGEDVVSGRRSAAGHEALAHAAPPVWEALRAAFQQLETAFADMQDVEFTVEDGRLWLLQTRSGKRTPLAAARIALDLLDEGRIDRDEARRRTDGLERSALEVVRLEAEDAEPLRRLARAAVACTGVVSGEIALDEDRVRARVVTGAPLVLVRDDADTRDLAALERCAGLLTARGARTAHAAVVARQLGKVCLVGCDALRIDLAARQVHFAGRTLAEGDRITLDGQGGWVLDGECRVVRRAPEGLLERLEALRVA